MHHYYYNINDAHLIFNILLAKNMLMSSLIKWQVNNDL